jgi:RNA polymerase sigma-70 factor (ECF subfamily)
MDEQWQNWMRQAQKGDQAAYAALLSAVRPWLVRFFAKRGQMAALDDLVQETMMTLHEKRHTYDPDQPFLPWLSTVAKHRWIDHLRKVSRRMEIEFDDEMSVPFFDTDMTASRDVATLLKRLPPAQAEVIGLVKIREMTIEQAAQQTGHTPSSVKVMIHRGLKRLLAVAKEEDMHNDL